MREFGIHENEYGTRHIIVRVPPKDVWYDYVELMNPDDAPSMLKTLREKEAKTDA